MHIIDTRGSRQACVMCSPFGVVTLSSVTYLAPVSVQQYTWYDPGRNAVCPLSPCKPFDDAYCGRQVLALLPARVVRPPLSNGRFDNHVLVHSDIIEVRVSCTLQ